MKSGLGWWDHGLRRAYIWLEAEAPLCVQWLLTRADAPKLRTLPDWAAMYPPLPDGRGQVENLFAFRNVQRPGVGIRFLYGMCEVERRAGLSDVITHISEENTAACSLSERVGWRRYGTITRYWFDLRGLRRWSICLHRTGILRKATRAPVTRAP